MHSLSAVRPRAPCLAGRFAPKRSPRTRAYSAYSSRLVSQAVERYGVRSCNVAFYFSISPLDPNSILRAAKTPCEPPSNTGGPGGFGEDCLSSRTFYVFFHNESEFHSRPARRVTQGIPGRGRLTGAAFSWVTFFWPRKRK